jgi:hypothetical protein
MGYGAHPLPTLGAVAPVPPCLKSNSIPPFVLASGFPDVDFLACPSWRSGPTAPGFRSLIADAVRSLSRAAVRLVRAMTYPALGERQSLGARCNH